MQHGRPDDEAVRQMPVVRHGVVTPQDIDINDHMNINVYFRLLTESTIEALEPQGLGFDYPRTRAMGLFSVDHHAHYLAELRLHAPYTLHVRLLSATDRGVHTVAYLRDSNRERVSCTLESALLNVDHASRKVARFPPDITQRLLDRYQLDAALPWDPATCGRITIPGRPLLGPLATCGDAPNPSLEPWLSTAIREARQTIADLDGSETSNSDALFYTMGYNELRVALEDLLAALDSSHPGPPPNKY